MTEFDSDHAHDMYAPATAPMTDHEKRIRSLLDYHANSQCELVAADKADLRALLADLDAVRVKAARYDYLSERLVGADFDWNESGMQVLAFEVEPGTQVWATADKTIDGAIAALKGAPHD